MPPGGRRCGPDWHIKPVGSIPTASEATPVRPPGNSKCAVPRRPHMPRGRRCGGRSAGAPTHAAAWPPHADAHVRVRVSARGSGIDTAHAQQKLNQGRGPWGGGAGRCWMEDLGGRGSGCPWGLALSIDYLCTRTLCNF